MNSPFDTRPSFTRFGPFHGLHQNVFKLTDLESGSDEDSSWPFGFSSTNSREKLGSSVEDGDVLREALGRDTEPLGE